IILKISLMEKRVTQELHQILKLLSTIEEEKKC
ncbi:hypothetical protein A5867_000959, partial [Enterococcus sp. 6D12_DIV0197]